MLDLTSIITNPDNIALVNEHGGCVLTPSDGLTFELHTLFLPAGRGTEHFKVADYGLTYMFARTPCREIVTKVPQNNRNAVFAARHMGFKPKFRRASSWVYGDGLTVDISYEGLTLDDWAMSSPLAYEAGLSFHRQIEAADKAFGWNLPDHPPDESHDRAAGAAYLMIEASNVHKGAWYYNRWASLTGYAPIRILREAPLMIDVGAGVIVAPHAGQMEVLPCRLA